MVELRPSILKLDKDGACPDPDMFEKAMCGIEYRHVDLLTRSEPPEGGGKWVNSSEAVAFELRQPSVGAMAELTKAIGSLRPTTVDYMHSCGDQCVVYWLSWHVEPPIESKE